MELLQRLLGQRRKLHEAQAALAAGKFADGLSLLSSGARGVEANALKEAARFAQAGDIQTAAEFLFGYREITIGIDIALHALGAAVFKENWWRAVSWLPSRLYHFTDLSNLPDLISRQEILSRFQLELKGIDPPAPGGDARSWGRDRQQKLLDYIHLSLIAPHPMLFSAAARIRRPVYIALKPVLILRKETRYSDRNATDAGARLFQELDDFRGIAQRALSGFHPAENKPAIQAEVLIYQAICLHPHLLTAVLFRSRYELESALKTCNPGEWLRQRFMVDESIFP